MPLYLLSEPTEPLVAPAIVAALDGWIDAAGASTTAAERLADGAAPLATFDGDLLFDFRSRRPVLDVVDGRLSELTWPELTLRHRRALCFRHFFCNGAQSSGKEWETA